MPMSFEQFKARQQFKAQFIEPIATNVRLVIMDRIAAALEWAQYGDAGAAGQPVLKPFVKDFNSEAGFAATEWPVLMVIPLDTEAETEDYISEKHKIYIGFDLGRDISPGNLEDLSTILTRDCMLYLKAIVHICYTFTKGDLIQGIASPGVLGTCLWDVTGHNYDGFRRRGTSIMLRSASCRLEVQTAEA